MTLPTDNPAVDEKLVELQEQLRRQNDEDLLNLIAQPLGRRFIARIVWDTTRLERASFTGDPQTTAFNEGQRSVGVYLMGECLWVAPAELLLMRQERAKDDLDAELKRHLAEGRAKPPG